MLDIEKTLVSLRAKGLKVTKYKTLLLTLFKANNKPLSISDIQDYFTKQKLSPNKTTIYREIETLLDLGIIHALDLGDEKKRYELSSLEHHHHLICQNCATIEDVIIKDDMQEIEKKVKKITKFKINSHALEFFGLCPNCQ